MTVDNTPYAPPKARVEVAEPPAPPARRPISIWIAQGLLAVTIVVWGLSLFQVLRRGGTVFVTDMTVFVVLVLLVSLFIGLVFRQRWARWGAFAYVLLITVAASASAFLRLAASRGRIDSAYWTGEVVGTLLVLALMIYFCYAVAFGKKARAFFATRR